MLVSPSTCRHRMETEHDSRETQGGRNAPIRNTFDFAIFDHLNGAHYCEVSNAVVY